ncbi:50S ribosomal protein L15 [bacterium]|jgi:large subunit ribosomal protein L15|nr:50S ribosomal protein L15 [bacterium]NBX77908.1 50S ribosomal protein L15 [bacterium]
MLTLNNLVRLKKDRKRVGRGGSRGGTSGRGYKGQKARTSGTVPARFEGGQMPIARRLPKRGFTNALFKTRYSVVSLDTLERLFEDGQTITLQALFEKNCVKVNEPYKILGKTLSKKLTIEAHACSQGARQAIENKGGEVRIIQER